MDLELRGKHVVVTGGTRGIGWAIADAFAREGANVSLCARSSEGVQVAIARLRSFGTRVAGAALDVRDSEAIKSWFSEIAREMNGFDVLIWNVSAQSYDWTASFETDLRACVQCVESALPYLRTSDAPAIIGIASQAALLSVPSYKAYSAIKAALISYFSSLSREHARSGIRVNCVSPGETFFEGGFWDRIQREDPELYARAVEKNHGRRLGRPEEVAKAVVFLASSAASFISGTNLLVDYSSRDHVQF